MKEMMQLSELNGLVKKTITGAFPAKLWVIGEISEMKLQRSGHCYLVLIEKDPLSDTVVAQARATIWSYIYRMLRPYFETTTGQVLIEGLKVLVQVSVEFHELYGYSLNIQDIDPNYTLGDMARRKTEIIQRLTREGVLEMNKEVEFPEVPQRIAVISSETAAGYLDFTNHLKNNQGGYVFYHKLFPAIMQGPQTEASIILALDRIYQFENFFDVVVIIRGGGSQFDLSCFDNYNIAYHVTQFPLPVVTGIGHEKDNSVVDLVAHTRLKTPTAVAEFLIGSVARFDLKLQESETRFKESLSKHLQEANKTVDRLARLAGPLIRQKINTSLQDLNQKFWKTDHFIKLGMSNQNYILTQKNERLNRGIREYLTEKNKKIESVGSAALSRLKMMIPANREKLDRKFAALTYSLHRRISDENHKIELVAQELYLKDPLRILSRGYSITTLNGKIIRDIHQINTGDLIKTILHSGTIHSKVIEGDAGPNS